MVERPQILYFGKGSSLDSHSHVHPFYQLEICAEGAFSGKSLKDTVYFTPGVSWLIPPETLHSFSAVTPRLYYTLKFTCSTALPESVLQDEVTSYHIRAICALIDGKATLSPFSVSGKTVMEDHLELCLEHIAQIQSATDKITESRFLQQLKETICVQGYRMNVKLLADSIGMNRARFKYRFQKEIGARITIKEFINKVLLEMAESHLIYSGMKLAEIAALMNFPNAAIFSRFIHSETGVYPKEYRKKLRSM